MDMTKQCFTLIEKLRRLKEWHLIMYERWKTESKDRRKDKLPQLIINILILICQNYCFGWLTFDGFIRKVSMSLTRKR